VALRHPSPQHFPKQRFFVAEVVVEHAFVDRRTLRNRIHSRPGKTFRGKLLERGGKDPLPASLRISRPA
jgi:hypothetical protein